jgi:OmcA/MtrC family decaheme c-type cytochrome
MMKISKLLRVGRFVMPALLGVSLTGCLGGGDGVTIGGIKFGGEQAADVVKVSELSAEQWANLEPKAEITSAAINSPTVVNFKLSADGKPLVGLTSNLSFAVAKLIPATPSVPSKWVSYIVVGNTGTPGRPSTENNGTLVDNGDGSYTYTFNRLITGGTGSVQAAVAAFTNSGNNRKEDLGDLTYNPNLVHRVTVQLSGNRAYSGTNIALRNPENAAYDFIPATGQAVPSGREIVKNTNCNECHQQLNHMGFHGGGRWDAQYCMVCHTDQRKFGRLSTDSNYVSAHGFAVNDMRHMVHKLHMEGGYPMLSGGQKMCVKCHVGESDKDHPGLSSKVAANGDNWKLKPSIHACTGCHTGLNFQTGAITKINGQTSTHPLTPLSDDSTCAGCHAAGNSVAPTKAIDVVHRTTDKTKHNPVLPAGLHHIEYEIASASASATVPEGKTGLTATVKFRIKKDGSAITFNSTSPILTGFTGSPNIFMAYARAQDGINPADFNLLGRNNAQPGSVSLQNLLAGTGGSMAGPDADGYYTATIDNAFPADATRRAVNLQGTFTQAAGTNGIAANTARHAITAVRSVETTANSRRTVVDSSKCSNCHEWFKGHGGSRVYETGVCIQCHNPNMSTTGHALASTSITGLSDTNKALLVQWGVFSSLDELNAVNNDGVAQKLPSISNNFKDLIHNIHKGENHDSPFFNLRGGQGIVYDFSHVVFPGVLKNCQTCHAPGTHNNVPTTALASTVRAVNADYAAAQTRANAQASLTTVGTNPDDLVTTPSTAACMSCHSDAAAQNHMQLNGGQIKVKRANHNSANESCATCHGPGATFNVDKVHSATYFK